MPGDSAAETRPRTPLSGRSPATLGLGLVVGVVLGVAVGEIRAFDAFEAPVPSRFGERVELVELIEAEQQRVDALEGRVDALADEVAAVEEEALADAGAAARLERDVEALEVPAGTTPVRGPGLRVEVDDAVEGHVEGASVDDVIIHEEDLQAIINAMWAGGAEVMSVNGQRVRATTAIRCVGNVLLLHGRTYSPPYRIDAVGDPRGMRDELTRDAGATAFAAHAERFDLGFDVQRHDELVIPAADRLTSLRAARVADDAAMTGSSR